MKPIARNLCLFTALLAAAVIAALPAGAADSPGPDLPAPDWAEVVSRIHTRHPLLRAADEAAMAGRALLEQAGRRANPELEVEWENFAGSGDIGGAGASELTVLLSQELALGGKLDFRRRAAYARSAVTDAERRSLLADLVLEARSAFAVVWAAQQRAGLAAERRDLCAELLRETERRAGAGAASQVDLSRARVELAAAELDVRRAAADQATACRSLAAVWNGAADFAGVRGDPDTSMAHALDMEETGNVADIKLAGAIASNPDLLAKLREEALQGVLGRLARAEGAVDISVGVGVKHHAETGDQAFVVAAGLPLPLRNPNEGEVRAARHEELRLRHERAALEGRLRAQLDLALRDRRTAVDEIASLEGEIIPQAQAAHDATVVGHARGLFSLTDVLETRRALFELREAGIDAALRCAGALARIERLTGAGGRALDELSEEN